MKLRPELSGRTFTLPDASGTLAGVAEQMKAITRSVWDTWEVHSPPAYRPFRGRDPLPSEREGKR